MKWGGKPEGNATTGGKARTAGRVAAEGHPRCPPVRKSRTWFEELTKCREPVGTGAVLMDMGKTVEK